jgi:hypothetical protein
VLGILTDEDRRSAMAAASGEHLEDFDRDSMVRSLEELYRWLT